MKIFGPFKKCAYACAPILKIGNMKESLNTRNGSTHEEGTYVPHLEIDDTIADYNGKLKSATNEHSKEFCQRMIDDLLFEKELTIKTTKSILKAAIKGAIKDVSLYYPTLLGWREDSLFSQLRTNRRPFSENMIIEFGKTIHAISVPCKDGLVRVFDIKIDAFYGYGQQRKRKLTRCVNVYYSLRKPSESNNQIPVEYGIN